MFLTFGAFQQRGMRGCSHVLNCTAGNLLVQLLQNGVRSIKSNRLTAGLNWFNCLLVILLLSESHVETDKIIKSLLKFAKSSFWFSSHGSSKQGLM